MKKLLIVVLLVLALVVMVAPVSADPPEDNAAQMCSAWAQDPVFFYEILGFVSHGDCVSSLHLPQGGGYDANVLCDTFGSSFDNHGQCVSAFTSH